MESTPQATQREITVESLALVRARRSDFQVFNELLVQYPLPKRKRLGQVVPDNMVVIHPELIDAEGSYDVPLQPVGPYWVLEYVSKSNRRKDYVDNMRKYEHELKVPYYMLFAPDQQELALYRHQGERYSSVVPNESGRCAIPELELEVGLLDGWVRYWYQGKLLMLPGDLQSALAQTGKVFEYKKQQYSKPLGKYYEIWELREIMGEKSPTEVSVVLRRIGDGNITFLSVYDRKTKNKIGTKKPLNKE